MPESSIGPKTVEPFEERARELRRQASKVERDKERLFNDLVSLCAKKAVELEDASIMLHSALSGASESENLSVKSGSTAVQVRLPARIMDRPWTARDVQRLSEWADEAGSGEAAAILWAVATAINESESQ